ncbi:MAG: transporter substrate-binding domain-containing protein [Chlamydiales bacterium]|nr:transporter substrate-binding domain-containing protein [Chlamydiales bacterium]
MFLFILNFLLLSATIFASTNNEKELVVGTTGAYAPYVCLNEQGEYEGFDISVAKELATLLNKKLVLKDLGGLQPLFLALKQNKIDLILFAVSITEERMQKMQMIHYQGEDTVEMPLLFWKKIPDRIVSIEDLAKRDCVVCVEAGSYQEKCAEKFSLKNLKQTDSIQDALMEIKYGKAVATFADPSMLPRFLKQYKELQVIQIPIPKEEQAYGNGICINKNNTVLKLDVEKAINLLKANGTIQALEEKWGLR